MKKMNGESLNLTQQNINHLKELFPEILTENKIDFEKLRLILGDEVETSPERYEFRWNGKNEAIKLSQTPSMGTLRPDKESSKNWDTTENLYIEGDNLEVLKLLQKSYFGKVKMIYIDPPYNTGKDFVYKDNFHDNIANYKEITNQSTKANPETNGRFHTDWLNMMYPRLRLARNLLKDDGVIFISIDDTEVNNLKKICDEIFGEMNCYGTFVWQRRSGSMDSTDNVSVDHEYVICYAKFKKQLKGIKRNFSKYKNPDNDPRGPWISDNLTAGKPGGDVYYPIEDPETGNIFYPPKGRYWPYSPITMRQKIEEGRIIFPKNSDGRPMLKRFMSEAKNLFVPVSTIMRNYTDKDIPNNSMICALNIKGTNEIQELFGEKIFSYPKSTVLLKSLLDQGTVKDSIVLDFFSGSSTLADAVMQMNASDYGNRKFIMVQIPEKFENNNINSSYAYHNICEIGKERINRAGDRIVKESNKKDLDIGFKVFKLDDSNIKTWDSKTKYLEKTIFNIIDNLKNDRNQEDLLYELMLKMGIELTANIEEVYVGNKKIYNIHSGGLVICLENEITKEIIEYIPTLKSPFIEMKVVFKEYGFITDADKLNAIQNLRQHGINDVRSV